MFASPPLWRASAFLGAGSAGSYANRRRLRGVVSLSHAIASLEAGKSAGWPWLIRHSGAVTDLGATLGDPLNQKDQGVHACLQGTDTIDKLIGAIFKPSHPGFKRTYPVDQIAFERDHSAIQTGDVVLQAVQSPSNKLCGYGLAHVTRPERPKCAAVDQPDR